MVKTTNPILETAYLQISPYEIDRGQLIGRDPREISKKDIIALGHPQTPLAAIRRRCLECCCGSRAEVRKCTAENCPSWFFRMEFNPYRSKTRKSAEQKSELRERARAARAAKGVS